MLFKNVKNKMNLRSLSEVFCLNQPASEYDLGKVTLLNVATNEHRVIGFWQFELKTNHLSIMLSERKGYLNISCEVAREQLNLDVKEISIQAA
jgi:hypothetical protein